MKTNLKKIGSKIILKEDNTKSTEFLYMCYSKEKVFKKLCQSFTQK